MEVTETATVEATEEPAETEEEEPGAAEEAEEPVIVLASELMDNPIQDGAGAEIGFVDEVLVDDSGAIQYVVTEVLPAQEPGAAETGGITDTTQPTQTGQPAERTFVAVPWDAFEVEMAAAAGSEGEAGTEEITGTEEVTGTGAAEQPAEVTLIYAGDTALEEQPSFDMGASLEL